MNIYEIMAEQKLLVDINIATYDLDYTLNTLNSGRFYIEEGLGDTMKNAANKVLEFIKTLIAKLKTLFAKVRDFLLNRGSKGMRKLNQVKQGAVQSNKDNKDKKDSDNNSGGGGASNNDNNKNEKSSANLFDLNAIKNVNPDALTPEILLRGSLRKVGIIKYVHLDKKKELITNFTDGLNYTAGNYAQNENAKEIKDVFKNSIKKKVFKGEGSYKTNKDENVNVVDRIHLELKEPRKPEQVDVKSIPQDIFMSYIYAVEADAKEQEKQNAKEGKLGLYFKKIENDAYKNLRIIEARVKQNVNEKGEVADEASYANVQYVITMVGTFLNYMTNNIVKAYNNYDNLLSLVVGDYIQATVGK